MQDSVQKMVGQSLINSQENLAETERQLVKKAAYYHRNKVQVNLVAEALSKLNIISASIESSCFDISITGDKHDLKAIFAAFRKLGYEPDSRPTDEPKATFTCNWDHPGLEARFWVYFTSTKCTRVQVRTETREVPVYETVCE